MSLVRDIQSKLGAKALAAITLATGAIANQAGAVIDTIGFNSLSLVLTSARAIVEGTDLVTYKFQDSADGSTDWQDIPIDGHLPYRLNPDRLLVDPQDGFSQTIGCFSTRQFVRPVFNGTVDTSDIVLSPVAILESNEMEFTGYDTAVVPSDGLP
jgi:hypothetical protein